MTIESESDEIPGPTTEKRRKKRKEIADVVLDSTSLQNVFFGNSVLLGTLSRLASKGEVRIHVPEVVLQEVTSQHVERISEAMRGASKSIDVLQELSPYSPEFARASQLVKKGAAQLSEQLQSRIDTWLREARVAAVPIAPAHGGRVLGRYFSGRPPFRQAKNRQDFPDAFVWEAVIDLIGRSSGIHFVTNDTGFGPAVQELAGKVIVHNDLKELFRTGALPITVADADRELAGKLRGEVATLVDEVRAIVHSSLPGRSLPTPLGILPEGEDSPFTIEHVLALKDLVIGSDTISLLGNLTYVVRFSASATLRAHYESGGRWQDRTFNLSESSFIRGEYDADLTGSLIIRVVSGDALRKPSTEIELDEVALADCRPAGQLTEGADTGQVGIRARTRQLKRAIDTARGCIMVVGRHRVRRLRAASTLLNNLADAHPDDLFLSGHNHYEVPSIGFVRPIRRNDFGSREDYTGRIIDLDPTGMSCDLTDGWSFEGVISLHPDEKIVVIVTDAQHEDDVDDQVYRFWPDPVVVLAT